MRPTNAEIESSIFLNWILGVGEILFGNIPKIIKYKQIGCCCFELLKFHYNVKFDGTLPLYDILMRALGHSPHIERWSPMPKIFKAHSVRAAGHCKEV